MNSHPIARIPTSLQSDSASEVPRPKIQPLPSPRALAQKHPLSASALLQVHNARNRIQKRLETGHGPLIAIVGPCSIHSEESALRYAERLAPVAERLQEDLIVVMRAYFEKPRTTVGWKGFLYDPQLDGSDQLELGLTRARALLTQLAQLGLPLATEILDPLTCDYFEDCLSWVAIGARTAESQIHRQAASRLPCPVGIKNGTDGSVEVAAHAMLSARERHSFLGIDSQGQIAVRTSSGNPFTHLVLRGGQSGPNYDAASIARIAEALQKKQLKAQVLVDASHGNSEKDYRRQPAVVRSVIEQLSLSNADRLGVMLESHLQAGQQKASPDARPEQSVTDACLDFSTTEQLLEELALATKRQRAARAQPTLL